MTTTPSVRATVRLRSHAVRAFLFSPVGRFNILTLLSSVIAGMILFAWGMASGANSPEQFITLIGGLALFIVAMTQFSIVFSKPYSKQESDRSMIASSGNITPTHLVKNHPDRVDAYRRFQTDMSLMSHDYKNSEAFINAGTLILSGALTEEYSHLIVAAIQQGAVTTEDIHASVQELRVSAVVPLLGGTL